MSGARHRARRDEAGALLVLWALLATGVFLMLAIVLDLGALRDDRLETRAAADAAALAGVGTGNVATDPGGSCATAFAFALQNLGISGTAPCSSAPTACVASPAIERTATFGDYTITVTNPVPNDSPLLLGAESIGGDIPQPYSAGTDGAEPCRRMAVTITHRRTALFARVAGRSSFTTTVHSVARKKAAIGTDKPALVTLEQTACPSIDAKNGLIHAFANGTKPGLIYADSNGTGAGCSGETVFTYQGNAATERVRADATTAPAQPGELGYVADDTNAFKGGIGNTVQFVGSKVKSATRITRAPVDSTFHCGNLAAPPPGCTTGSGGNDAISDVSARYASGVPAGFNPFPVGTESCTDPNVAFATGNWYVNCPVFEVKGKTVTFGAGTIVFNGDVVIEANGILNIGSASADSLAVVRGANGFTSTSNSWTINWQRTAMVMLNSTCDATSSGTPATCGTFTIKNGVVTWTSPESGGLKSLIFWSETSKAVSFGGNPAFSWRGVFFAGSAPFTIDGNSTLDALNVQLWVRTITVLSGSATLNLRPDPVRSVSTGGTAPALIR